MDNVTTLPRRTWAERTSLALACALVVIGIWTLVGWIAHVDAMVQPFSRFAPAPIKANEGLCFLAIGLALLGREFGIRNAAWVSLVPALVGAMTAAEGIWGVDLRIDELIARDSLLIETVFPGRGSVMAVGCIMLAGLTLAWRVTDRKARERLFAEAVSGSILFSVGFSTLLGYAFGLPAVYDWGTTTAMGALAAAALLVTGTALLVLAWRESLKNEGGFPAWLPMPAVIGSLTLTLMLWIGLQQRETAYLETKASTAREQIAVAINSVIEQQTNALYRLARNENDSPDNNLAAWQTDVASIFEEAKEYGCLSISLVDTNNADRHPRTRWSYPVQDNVGSIGFDHASDPRRSDAMAAADATDAPTVSTMHEIGEKRNWGFAVYARIGHNGNAARYVAAEYLYQRFFASVVRQLKITGDYSVVVTIGRVEVYRSSLSTDKVNEDKEFAKGYTIYDQRMRISLTPTADALARDRRYLPEMALFGGLLITLLLGFTLHLARRASLGQYLSELSNKRLVAENEERRRIEARLKVSDERLRLALDSTQIGIFEWNVTKGHVYYSPGLWSLLGYEHSRMPSTLEVWQSLIHTDDLPVYRKRTESQLNGIAAFIDPEYRVRSRTGDWRWVYVRSDHRDGPGHHDQARVGAGAAREPGRGPQALARRLKDGQPGHHRLRRRQDRMGQQRLLPRHGVHPRGGRRQGPGLPAQRAGHRRRPGRLHPQRDRQGRGREHRDHPLLQVGQEILPAPRGAAGAQPGRAGRELHRDRERHHVAGGDRDAAEARQGRGRLRLARQERVPRLDVARDPDADERRDRDDQHPDGDPADGRAARLRQHDPHLGRGPADHHQ
jgi:PAS domain S-box-containing protein